MEIGSRDAFDLALVALALVLVVLHVADGSEPETAVGALVAGIYGIDPIVYLVSFGTGGILFLAYALLYVPRQYS